MTDNFIFVKQSLLTTTKPIDLTLETEILGFEIGGAEPTTSKRRVAFEVDGRFYRFEGNNLMQIDLEKTVADVLAKGNTTAELLQVTNIPEWCGRLIFPIIALESTADASVMPSISFGIKVKSFSDIFQKSVLSPVIALGDLSKITAINFTKTVTGGGTANLQVKLLQNNSWTNFMSVDDAVGQTATKLQLKGLLSVTSLSGNSTAKITSAEVKFKNAGEIAAETSTIYFKAEDFSEDLSTAYILIKHNFLANNDLKVFVAFDNLPEVKNAVLGTGTGAAQSFTIDSGIDFDSLEIFVGGVKTYNFSLNALSRTLTLTANSGEIISVSYKYNVAAENWLECEKQFTELDQNSYAGDFLPIFASRYVYRLEAAENSKVAKVKIQATSDAQPIYIYKIAAAFSL